MATNSQQPLPEPKHSDNSIFKNTKRISNIWFDEDINTIICKAGTKYIALENSIVGSWFKEFTLEQLLEWKLRWRPSNDNT